METVRIVDERELPADLDAAIRRTLVTCFPKDAEFFLHSRAWHGCTPAFSAVVQEDNEVIAHLGVVQREVTVGGASVHVAGLQNICVLPDHRGRGLCRKMLDASMAEAKERGADFGLLFCVAQIVPVYERCGWCQLPNSSVVRVDLDGEEKPLANGNLPMWLPLNKGKFPAGEIYLGGNDW